MTIENDIKSLLEMSSTDDRICPIPTIWDNFWKMIGAPWGKLEPPLILNGWYASDRAKRKRFQEHVKFAADNGLFGEAERFIRILGNEDWHKCGPNELDWSLGDVLAQDQQKRDAVLENARQAHDQLLRISDSLAFRRENLAQFMYLMQLLWVPGVDIELEMTNLRRSLENLASLSEAFDPFEGCDRCVIGEIQKLARSKQEELLFLRLLCCIADRDWQGKRPDVGRAEIDEFLDEMST